MRVHFEQGPDLNAPVLDLLFVALDRPSNRHLWCPVQLFEASRDVPLVVGDPELLLDDLGDTGARPHLATETVGFNSMPQEVGDEAHLIRLQLGGGTWVMSHEQSSRTLITSLRDSMADSTLSDAKRASNESLPPSELVELPGTHPWPFLQVQVVELVKVHVSFYGPENFTYLRNAK
jgi:hypothetical protein